MATAQEPIKVYLPRAEAAEFKRLVVEEDRTIAAVMRRLIRDYIASRAAA